MRTVHAVSDEVVGFGPIEFLLKDPEATEVMAVGPDDVYMRARGADREGLRGSSAACDADHRPPG